ncbi:hypothetical protein ACWC5I_38910 [Kitasatospora sp. NPDC001574]
MLAPPGTVRVLLGARHHELAPEERPQEPPDLDGLDGAAIEDRLRHLQRAGLLDRNGSTDIERQATTEAVGALWTSWVSALNAANAVGLEEPGQHVAVTIEKVLAAATRPGVLTSVRGLHLMPDPLKAAVAGGADLLRKGLSRDGAGGQLPGLRATVESARYLALMYDTLGEWHAAHYPPDRVSAATGRGRHRAGAAPAVPAPAPPPGVPASDRTSGPKAPGR